MTLQDDFDPVYTDGFKNKSGALERLGEHTGRMTELQESLHAQDKYCVLMVF